MSGRTRSFDTVFVITLMCAFIIISLLLVGIGANLYRTQQETSQGDYELRTALSYVSNRVKQCRGETEIEEFGGVRTLTFTEEIAGVDYLTYIYYYDGALRELFTAADSQFDPEQGQTVTALADFTFKLQDGVLTLRAQSTKGSARTLSLYAD